MENKEKHQSHCDDHGHLLLPAILFVLVLLLLYSTVLFLFCKYMLLDMDDDGI